MKMKRPFWLTPERFRYRLPLSCARDTSYRNDAAWSPNCPTLGHCTVVALLVQDFFGGSLLRVSLKDTAFARARFHYYNRLPDGRIFDFTRDQFNREFPENLKPIERNRNEVLRVADVAARYRKLRRRFLRMWDC